MSSALKYQVYGLNEVYPELGRYEFKIVMNPKSYKPEHQLDVLLLDSDRKLMNFEVKKWGRKLNVNFHVSPEVSDGVSTAIISRDGTEIGRLSFWIIKP